MESKSKVCTECYQGISNPICEQCYTKQLTIWLHSQGVDSMITSMISRAIRQRFPDESELETDDQCILCLIQTASLCTYCYFFKIERILRSLNLPEPMIDHFLEIFNYKLYSAIYTRDDFV